jgi:hypothetical protein
VHLLEIDQHERRDHQREEEIEDALDKAGDDRLAESHRIVQLALQTDDALLHVAA